MQHAFSFLLWLNQAGTAKKKMKRPVLPTSLRIRIPIVDYSSAKYFEPKGEIVALSQLELWNSSPTGDQK